MLYDFEAKDGLVGWENLVLPGDKEREPTVKMEQVPDHATSGKQSLETDLCRRELADGDDDESGRCVAPLPDFSRGCVRTAGLPGRIHGLSREEPAGGRVGPAHQSLDEDSLFAEGGKPHRRRVPQPNDYAIHAKWGKVVRLEIFMYAPHEGESIYIDKISLSSEKLPPPVETTFAVAGTDIRLPGKSSADAVIAPGKQFKDKWKPPQSQSVAQVEEQMRAEFAELKKTHPRAVLAIFRDGERGFDPADANKVYAGWKDAYFNSHGPDGNYVDRARNGGRSTSYEVFMRHRSPVMRVDLSSIPQAEHPGRSARRGAVYSRPVRP